MSSTRAAILDACWRLLDAGRAPLAMDDVAAGAGVSRQAVYLHFKSKAELVVAVVEHAKKEIGLDEVRARIDGARTGEAALAALIDAHVELTPKLLRASRAIEAERARDPALEAAWQERESSRLSLVRRVVDRLVEERRLARGWSAGDAADLLWALTAAPITEDLLTRRRWSGDALRRRLDGLVRATILCPTHVPNPKKREKKT